MFLALAAFVLLCFFIFGDTLSELFSQAGTVSFLLSYGSFAWVIAILLLMGDLLFPLPATIIMAALGYHYGPIAGGLISAVGSFMAGSLGYWLCRAMGEKTARWLLGEKDYARGHKLSGNIGAWVVVLSRWLPVFPEVIACMCGLTRMPALYFHSALLCGSIPLGFTYAFLGSTGVEYPLLAIILSAGVPPLIWLLVRPLVQSKLNSNVG